MHLLLALKVSTSAACADVSAPPDGTPTDIAMTLQQSAYAALAGNYQESAE